MGVQEVPQLDDRLSVLLLLLLLLLRHLTIRLLPLLPVVFVGMLMLVQVIEYPVVRPVASPSFVSSFRMHQASSDPKVDSAAAGEDDTCGRLEGGL